MHNRDGCNDNLTCFVEMEGFSVGRSTVLLVIAFAGCSEAPMRNIPGKVTVTDAADQYRQGTELLESNPEKAIDFLTNSLAIGPDAPPALYNRALAFARVGRDDEAVADMKRLEEVEPAVGKQLRAEFMLAAAPYVDLGNREVEAGNFDAAIKKYESALAYNPSYGDAWVGKGIALHKKGEADAALGCYNRAAEVEPDNYYAYINRAELQHELKRLKAALSDYTKAIELRSEEPDAYTGRSSAYTDLQQADEAASDVLKAKEIKAKVEADEPT